MDRVFCRPFQRGLAIALALINATLRMPAGQTTALGPAQGYHVTSWTTENGLPQNTVRCLAQTPDGYIWAGTGNGLARFDGVRFRVFTRELLSTDGLDASCLELKVDGNGRLWIRLPDALVCYYQGRFERFATKSPDGNGAIQTILASRNDGLWLGAQSKGLQRFERGQVTHQVGTANGLATTWVGLLNEDAQGRIWIGCTAPRAPVILCWQRWDPVAGRLVALTNVLGQTLSHVRDVLPGAQGELWLSLPGELVCWKEGTLNRYDMRAVMGNGLISRLIEDQAGALWFALNRSAKLVRLAQGSFEIFNLEEQSVERDIRGILPDRDGNIWIGTGGQGLLRVQPRRLLSIATTNDSGDRQEIHSVAAGTNGVVWLATGGSLLRWQNDTMQRFPDLVGAGNRPAPGPRAVFVEQSGQVWAKTANQGLLKLADGQFVRAPEADVGGSNWTVTAFHEDRSGRLWIGSTDGLLVRRGKGFVRYTTRDGLSGDDISGIRDGPEGSLWIGTKSGGLNHFQDGHFRSFTRRDGLLANSVYPLLVEDDGTVWAGTDHGLNRIRPGEIRSVTEEQGLFDNTIYSLLDDGRGNYWSHGNHGIFRMRKSDLHAVADGRQDRLNCGSYGEVDGMASAEGNGSCQPSACRAGDGRMWFPTTRGVAVIDPAALLKPEMSPPVLIEEVMADDEILFPFAAVSNGSNAKPDRTVPLVRGDASPATRPSSPAPVILPPGRARVLEIHYTANSFVAPEKIRFHYRLEGVDPQWRAAGTRRVAYYTNLRPGSYRFELKAVNHRGHWNDAPAVFSFRLEPHFWQTWPFYALCGLAAMSLAGGFTAYRLRWQRRLLKVEQQQALANERTRIARDLHDDLGTALTGIALEIDVARSQSHDGTATRLGESAARVRTLAERMREVVWAVNPRCDTVSSLASFLEQQAGQFLHQANLRVRFDFPEDIPTLPLDSETRHQLALGVREALTNIVRHAAATEAVVSLKIEQHTLIVEVADNGRGFQPADTADHGQGLLSLSARLERMGGRFECASTPGHGTTARFRVPLDARPSRRNSNS